ncbi:methionine ABC transporter ATP-binding protein [Bacillus sp. JJ722]|uniref:methionine ABC transporter ATP-binding protein n=1 Tax=Bacillus sp. JJ722 TaxID=3122973 RepID=UPI002FFE3155
MIEFQNISKIFKSAGKEVEALKGIRLTIEQGDIFGVIGFSGAGKSTLIRTVNLLEYPTAGEVLIEGRNLTKLSDKHLREAKKKIGMIFQHFNLLNSKTVFENVAMPLRLSKTKQIEIENRVNQLLRFVGLEDKANSYPDQLSGGQKQRVGIARALVTNPSILLCDEATSALDPQTTKSILELLKRVNEEYKITILIITHEMEVIKQICNRVAVMEDGRIIESGSVFNMFSNPQTNTARNFVHSVIRDEVPDSVIHLLGDTKRQSRIYKIDFLGVSSSQPIVSSTAKEFDVEINILFGNITELQGIPFGNLIVEISGSDREIERAHQYIATKNVTINEVTNKGVTGDGSKQRTDFGGIVGNVVHG